MIEMKHQMKVDMSEIDPHTLSLVQEDLTILDGSVVGNDMILFWADIL